MTKTTLRQREPRFEVEWTTEAWTEVRALPPPARGSLMRAAAALARDAEMETRTRTRLVARSGALPKVMPRVTPQRTSNVTWETRTRSGHRLLYCVVGPVRGEGRRCARILRLVPSEREEHRSTLSRAEARELRSRAETLRKLGGGIPHEVVRLIWIWEMERTSPGD
jgi:hypothetical protein